MFGQRVIFGTVELFCAHPVHTFWNEQHTRVTVLMHGVYDTPIKHKNQVLMLAGTMSLV